MVDQTYRLTMKALYVYQDEYPWDIRVDKIVNSLTCEGISTIVLCRNRSGLSREQNMTSGITVRRLPKGFTSFDRTIMNFPAFFSPIWLYELAKTVKLESPQIIIVRDLPLSPAAYFVGKLFHKPVLMDMAENYPAMIQDTWKFRGPAPFDYLIRNPILLRQLEKWIIPRLDGIWVVSEASRERILKMKCRHPYMQVIGNTPRLSNNEAHQEYIPLLEIVEIMKRRDALRLLYVGGLEETRGIQTVIRSLPLILNKLSKDILFVVVGLGTSMNYLKKLVTELGVESYVYFAGWIDQQYVPAIISLADICLVPHYVTQHTETTIPNKIFDYMAQSKPVVVTHARSLRDIVDECKCGRIYQDKDIECLADCIVELDNENLRNHLGNAGRQAVLERYNWKNDEKKLVDSVQQITSSYVSKRSCE